jgi:hypothetical protein
MTEDDGWATELGFGVVGTWCGHDDEHAYWTWSLTEDSNNDPPYIP